MKPDAHLAHQDWLRPDWNAAAHVGALMTTRHGGVSETPFDSLNLGAAVGDAPGAVAQNRHLLERVIGARPVFLEQVHGAGVVRLTRADAEPGAAPYRADASVTTEPGVACAVRAADCLPVLFAAPLGRAVGAAHAGWRGLALGVLEATVAAVCAAARCEPHELQAWLGACIGPTAFEVGPDVLDAFGVAPAGPGSRRFIAAAPGKWRADLPGLARDRLEAAGVRSVTGGQWCTATDSSRFFSFRREGRTGRMAALVWIEADARG